MRGNREGGSHLFCSSRPNNRIGINISKAEFHIAEQTFIAYICNYIIYIYIYIYIRFLLLKLSGLRSVASSPPGHAKAETSVENLSVFLVEHGELKMPFAVRALASTES